MTPLVPGRVTRRPGTSRVTPGTIYPAGFVVSAEHLGVATLNRHLGMAGGSEHSWQSQALMAATQCRVGEGEFPGVELVTVLASGAAPSPRSPARAGRGPAAVARSPLLRDGLVQLRRVARRAQRGRHVDRPDRLRAETARSGQTSVQ
jgi:hypothetical protein